MKIILKGEPISTNNCYRTHNNYRYITNKARDLKESYAWQAKSQWNGKPIKDNIEIIINIFFGTKRKSDWDNFHKLSMDALEGIVFENDNQIQKATVIKNYDKNDPRIEIELSTD